MKIYQEALYGVTNSFLFGRHSLSLFCFFWSCVISSAVSYHATHLLCASLHQYEWPLLARRWTPYFYKSFPGYRTQLSLRYQVVLMFFWSIFVGSETVKPLPYTLLMQQYKQKKNDSEAQLWPISGVFMQGQCLMREIFFIFSLAWFTKAQNASSSRRHFY